MYYKTHKVNESDSRIDLTRVYHQEYMTYSKIFYKMT